jgi:hypothetical protein
MSESTNGAMIKFGAGLNQEDLNQIVENAINITKRKYDITFKPNMNADELANATAKFKSVIDKLKNKVNDDLDSLKIPEIDTDASTKKILELIEALKLLEQASNFEYMYFTQKEEQKFSKLKQSSRN